ncbi:hypothetical protein AYI69_g4179 [Smittium culicis]|uniref:Uncharacterized protein n=1 Tax=Smittium culicis TaxID=133412 RepID=A0A1R1YFR9_9FUNG|nr:hypothetical protein AYI69_g4179 [Smittium culicis]
MNLSLVVCGLVSRIFTLNQVMINELCALYALLVEWIPNLPGGTNGGASDFGNETDEVSINELLVPPANLADRLMQQLSMFANNEPGNGSKHLNGAVLGIESDILATKLSRLDEIPSGSAGLARNGSGIIRQVGGISSGPSQCGGDDDEDLGDPV